MSKIKIAHLRSSGGYFGAEAVIYNLVRALPPEKYLQKVILMKTGLPTYQDFASRLKEQSIQTEILPLRSRIDPAAIKQLARSLREQQVNILHCHGYKSDIIGYFVQKLFSKIKLVATMHGWTYMNWKVMLYEKMDTHFLRRFDRVIAVSTDVANQAKMEKIPESKIYVIPNAIDTAEYAQVKGDLNILDELGITNDDFILGTVARLSPEKGVEDLINAMPAVLAQKKECKLLVIGDGPEREKLEHLTGKLNIHKNIKFLGVRNNIAQILPLLDIFIMPSHREGTPMALLEAMAAGRPIVAARVGGIPKIIESGQSGRLVSPQNPNELARAICDLAAQPQTMARFGLEARKQVESNYSFKTMSRQMTDFYEG